jgi:hypothetical protein
VIHWHLNSKSFYWFVPDDFFHLEIPYLETISWGIYVCAWLILILKELNSRINIHFYKLGHMISTALVWIVGIVLYDNDWSFTSSNIVHHGVPYLALIWVSTMRGEYQTPFIPFTRFLSKMKKYRIFLYLFLVCFLGYSEEFLWDIFVWHEHSSVFLSGLNFEVSKTVLTLLVPLLSTPQLTHYILDGIIWKRERKIEGFSF